jgi:hypothetical protein
MPVLAAGGLDWRAKENRVSAEIAGSRVVPVLEQIAEATGWHIYIEPGTEHTVSTKFKDRTVGEALQLLLGSLSYVRVPPEANGPARLYVFRTTRSEATQLVSPIAKKDPTARPIPNELVMRLKPECSVEEVAKALQAKVLGRATVADTYRLSFETPEAAQAARKQAQEMTCVEAIDYNYWMHRPEVADSLSLPAGSNFDLKPRSSEDCATRIVGLIDTAIQPTGTSLDQFLLPGISVAGPAQLSADVPSHATSMAGRMMDGIAANQNQTSVKVLPVDVYGPNASTTTFDVANGIIQAVNKGATVINLSLGSAGDSDFLRDVVRRGAEQGVLFLAAAGNEPTTTPTYPAAYPHVMAVTAGGRDGKIAPYANRGEFIDISAPGSGMFPYNGQNWMVMGTSAATAYASGVAASLWDCNKASAGQVSASMLQLMPVKR